jgi:hypothetical protein
MYRTESESDIAMAPAPTAMLFEAIASKRCLEATYNGGQVLLAPQVAFVRHGDLYAGAVTIERDGKPPREEKLGIFKLDGLVDLRLSNRGFSRSPVFDPRDPRFTDSMLIAVEA